MAALGWPSTDTRRRWRRRLGFASLPVCLSPWLTIALMLSVRPCLFLPSRPLFLLVQLSALAPVRLAAAVCVIPFCVVAAVFRFYGSSRRSGVKVVAVLPL